MERKEIAHLKEKLEELVNILDELLLMEEDCTSSQKEAKTAMFIYKLLLLNKSLK